MEGKWAIASALKSLGGTPILSPLSCCKTKEKPIDHKFVKS